jgi:hypothetical protein
LKKMVLQLIFFSLCSKLNLCWTLFFGVALTICCLCACSERAFLAAHDRCG